MVPLAKFMIHSGWKCSQFILLTDKEEEIFSLDKRLVVFLQNYFDVFFIHYNMYPLKHDAIVLYHILMCCRVKLNVQLIALIFFSVIVN